MGLLSNTVSICQFNVVGDLPTENLIEWAGQCLAGQAFQSIEGSSEEQSSGWVHLDDFEACDFEAPETYARDHYLTFSLRRDRRRVPGGLLKAHLDRAEQKFLAEHPGLQRVPKNKREELREAVRGNLLSRTLPSPATFDAVWDTRNGRLTLTTLNGQIVEQFENLFKTTFEGLRLVALHPMARAAGVLDDNRKEALQQLNRAVNDTVLDQIKDNLWLGWDLLRWLVDRTLNSGSEYRVNQPGPALEGEGFAAYLNDRLVLSGGHEEGTQKITVAGPQDHFDEALAALDTGKDIGEGTLYLEKGELQWKMTLKGELFQFGSYRCPGVKLEKDALTDQNSERMAVFFERMYVLEEGLQLFDSLLSAFLEERLSENWRPPLTENTTTA
ncbi:MAG: recombination-associated protein RdgC [Pedobacter sp.]